MSFHIAATRPGFACLVAIVAAGGAHAQAPAQPSLTLQDAFARAQVDAPVMQAADQARLGAEASVRQADRAPNPTLDITAENLLGSGLYSGIDRSETTFALSQRLEWGEIRPSLCSVSDWRLWIDAAGSPSPGFSEVGPQFCRSALKHRVVRDSCGGSPRHLIEGRGADNA